MEIIQAFLKGTLECSTTICSQVLKDYMRQKHKWTKEQYDINYQIYLEWINQQ